MDEYLYWIWLSTLRGLSLRGQQTALGQLGSPEEIYQAGRSDIAQVQGLGSREREALENKDLTRAEGVLEDCQKYSISILTISDPHYPGRLKNIDTPPLVLYYKGNLLPFDGLPVITVVGARKASGYGLMSAKKLGQEIGECGGTVVSGAAKGIDSLALEGAMSAGASVAAVLGNGLDVVYPAGSEDLYRRIQEKGCLLSEYVPGTRPLGQNFPRRNRLMSGLSLGVLVVEAAKRSGSLITAELALEQGRDVFAVPGNIGLEACEGSNALIQEGAMLVTCGWDILREYEDQFPELLHQTSAGRAAPRQETIRVATPIRMPEVSKKPEASPESAAGKKPGPKTENRIDNGENRNYIDLHEIPAGLSEDEQTIVMALAQGQKHVDDLTAETGLAPAKVLSALTLLEIKGFVNRYPGSRFDLNTH